ncbi:trehalase family glycosidase [Paenibacillus lignilyticus]|uniref:Alpha-L-rhamnosidase n=1 Tax=Paenibacillus lignilyticus TaxID=1172615 RepID=A0ABS5CBW7_9BACL|nr:trehalase family glycosidase [Paenibacillus lignilyticus]MBP3961863.1 alpha-L-rhamnosidase [Paenibacillus lignilyticus]MBP3963466.1 alpha-L-rhamnosidase [Paenibacillus lignilyticus]
MTEAVWIWYPDQTAVQPNMYVDFRKKIALGHVNVIVKVSACQEYQLFVNGQLAGRGPSPCSPEWQYYDEINISSFLQEGENVLSAVVYHFGDKDIVTNQMQGPGGFWLQLESAEGEMLLGSDASWSCRISPRWETRNHRISRWGGFNEIYVVDREDGWQEKEYVEEDWLQAGIVARIGDAENPWTHLIPAEIAPLHREQVHPAAIIRTEANYGSVIGASELLARSPAAGMSVDCSAPYSLPGVVFDYGREVVGRPVIIIEAPEGGVMRLAYGESLELQYVDTFVLRRGNNAVSTFGRRACRFLQLSFLAAPKPLTVKELVFEHQHYDFKQQGTFVTNEERLNRIWDVSCYTTLMNSQDHLEDCPWREKALWVADAVVMGKVIYHVYGDTALLRKSLLQGARIQNEDGSIPGTGPERNAQMLTDFCGHWLLGVRDYWRYSGDCATIEQLWPNLLKLTDWFGAQKDETGLFAQADRPGWWCFIDWTVHIDKRDKVTCINALYVAVLEAMSEMSLALGKFEVSVDYRKHADQLKLDIRRQLWLADKEAFTDCIIGNTLSTNLSLQTNFLAAWCGIMTEAETTRFIERYYDTNALVEIKGAFFQHIVLEVFVRMGMTGRALELIRGYWGAMVDRGATTWWETFDASTPHGVTPSTYGGNVPTYLWEGPLVSQCHAWGASPAYILHQLISGIDVLRLGQGIIRLRKPADEGPDRLSAELPTRNGLIRAEWKREDGVYSGTVTVPSVYQVVRDEDMPKAIIVHFEKGAAVQR